MLIDMDGIVGAFSRCSNKKGALDGRLYLD
jgi:hypothetical protein